MTYDLAIVGGGLAGLSLAILQAKAGRRVVLFEKNAYPHHKVCGEYISLESWNFLEELGVPLNQLALPLIHKLEVTSPKGFVVRQQLDLGGFGISRYLLDNELVKIASDVGVTIEEKTTVEEIAESKGTFEIKTRTATYEATQVVGAFGKRANLDLKWQRKFIQQQRAHSQNYVGVKYHVKATGQPKDTIFLHNFQDGYCGFSAIENDTFCLCYLTTKQNLVSSNNRIAEMEERILKRNPQLRELLETVTPCWPQPLTISNISFSKKEQFYGQVPLVGDAAGMITPLCGNGMSMALHGAYLLHNRLLSNKLQKYESAWKAQFGTRLAVGRWVQKLFGEETITDWGLRGLAAAPPITRWLIRHSHGERFG